MSHPALQQAIALCQELVDLFATENEQIRKRDLKAIEATVVRKDNLAENFQKALAAVKKDIVAIKSNPAFAELHLKLKSLLISYNEAARRNVVLLQAAHTSATGFIKIVRQAMQPPAAKVYGKNGQMQEAVPVGAPLVTKSV